MTRAEQNPDAARMQLVNWCCFRAGWQVFHAGRHEDYASLVPAAKAGYDAAESGATDPGEAFERWRRPTFASAARRS